MECPKCKYVRQSSETHVLPGVCPNCGIAYQKWQPQDVVSKPARIYHREASDGLMSRLWQMSFAIPEQADSFDFGWRCAMYLGFIIWGGAFIVHGVDWVYIGSSFLHNINLPFHEFGHVIFRPFGRFMTILGGSLFQIILPLIAMVSFIVQMRDSFAASIMLWWCGQNFIDLAPYIGDAEYRGLPLIGGGGEESHDWGNLLTELNAVESCHALAQLSFNIGTSIIILSGIWGFILLKKFYRAGFAKS